MIAWDVTYFEGVTTSKKIRVSKRMRLLQGSPPPREIERIERINKKQMQQLDSSSLSLVMITLSYLILLMPYSHWLHMAYTYWIINWACAFKNIHVFNVLHVH